MEEYDVLIVGGGPASSAAAIHATALGLKACIIEREIFPRDRPGETLHPGVEPLLKQLGILESIHAANFVRHSGVKVSWLGPLEYQPYNKNSDEEWLGFQAHRRIFDNILINRAKELGVDVKMGCSAESLIIDKDQVKGITVNNEDLTAHYVLDGSGNWHWLARQLKIPFAKYSKELFVRYGYMTGQSSTIDNLPSIIADSDGWTWIAKIGNNLFQWTRLSLQGNKISSTWLPEELSSLTAIGSSKGADVTWRIAAQLAGPGFYLIGDAAAVLDPASSHGVLRALMSGIQAADLIVHTLNKKCPETAAIEMYHTRMRSWFKHDVIKLQELYNIFDICPTNKEEIS